MGRFIDLTGQRFGRLKVVKRSDDYRSPTGRPDPQWECSCDCGNKLIVRGCHLRNGHTQSCGCYQQEQAAQYHKKFNDYTIIGNKAYVLLSNSEKEMIVDADIWENGAKQYCWALGPDGYDIAAIRNRRDMRRFHVYAFPDCPKGMVRDHIDGNKLNNTRKNIRLASWTQNAQNKTKSGRGKSGRRGVYWNSRDKKWVVYISVNKEKIRIGTYKALDEAIKAREEAEEKYYGEYRRKR